MENNNENIEVLDNNIEVPKKSSKGLIIGIIMVVVLVIGIIAILVLPKIFFTGKKVVEKEVSVVFNQARKTLTENEKNILNYDLDKDSLGLEGTLTISSNYKDDSIDLTKLKNYKVNYQGVIDKSNNQASGKLSLVKSSSNLIGIDGYVKGKDILISLGDIYNKGLITEADKEIKDLELSKTKNTEDIKVLLDKTEKIVKDNIKDENITKSKEDKYTKIEYKLVVEELEKEILTAYQDDPEIIKALSNLTSKSEKEVKKSIKEELDNLKDITNTETITINLYLQGFNNTVKKIEIIKEQNKLVIEKDNDSYKYTMYSDSDEVFNGTYDSKSKEFTLKNEDTDIKIVKKDNTMTISLKSDNMNIDATINNKVKGNVQTNDATIKLTYDNDGKDVDITFKNNLRIEKNQKVEKIMSNETINLDEIPDEDYNNIMTKVYEKLTDIVNDIVPSMSESATSFRKVIE